MATGAESLSSGRQLGEYGGAQGSAEPRLNAATRWSYGAGAVAFGVKNTAFNTYLLLFYNQVLGIPAAIVATALAATLVLDAVIDPVIGRWSDVLRTRWGRRHPFIYAAAVPTTIFFILTWFPPAGLTDTQMGLWIFATAGLTRLCISAFELNTSAMAPELSEDYAQRTRLFSLRYWFGYVGAFGFGAFALTFFFVATPEYPRGQLNPAGYTSFAILGAVLILFSILICGLGTHNRIPYLRQATVREVSLSLGTHAREMYEAFRNRGFLAIFSYGLMKYTAIGVYSATTLYFGTYVFKLSAGQLALLTFDSLVAASIAAPLAPVASRLMGKRNSAMIFALTGITIGLTPLVLTLYDLYFLPGDPRLVISLFIVGAVYGAMIAVSLINTSSMLADVVEDSAVETGRHSAGTFFAASSFMQQCSAGLGILVAGLILSWSQFPERAAPGQVTDAMTDSLLAHYIPISFSLWVIGAVCLLFYPITKDKHERNLQVLKARQAEALSEEARGVAHGGPAR